MKIIFRRKFGRQYEKLRESDRIKVDKILTMFLANPYDPLLRNHALHGKMNGKRSISAANNLRLIFTVEGEYVTVIMLAVGSHNQVY